MSISKILTLNAFLICTFFASYYLTVVALNNSLYVPIFVAECGEVVSWSTYGGMANILTKFPKSLC